MRRPRFVALDLRSGSALWITIGAVGSAALTVVAFRVIGGLIGPDDFGEAVLLFGAVLLAANLVAGPIGQAIGRFYFGSTSPDQEARLFSTGAMLAACAFGLGVMVLASLAASHVITWTVALLLAGPLGCELMRPLATAWLHSQSRFRAVAISQLFDAGTRSIAAAGLAQLGVHGTKLALAAYALGGLVSVGLLTMIVAAGSPWRQPSAREARRIAAYGYPLVANSLFGWLGNSGDRYFIAAALGAHAAGIYVAASALGGRLALMMGNVVETFYRPKLYEAVAARDAFTIEQIGAAWQKRIVVWGLGVFVALLLSVPALKLLLLGPQFRDGAGIVIVLSFAAYWVVALGFYPIRINYACERTMRVAMTEVCGTVSMAITVPAFGLLFGLPGAGIGLIVTAVLRFSLATYFARRTLTAAVPVQPDAPDDPEHNREQREAS